MLAHIHPKTIQFASTLVPRVHGMPPKMLPFLRVAKTSDFLEKSPLSGTEKHHNFQVTSCHHFVTTEVKFDD